MCKVAFTNIRKPFIECLLPRIHFQFQRKNTLAYYISDSILHIYGIFCAANELLYFVFINSKLLCVKNQDEILIPSYPEVSTRNSIFPEPEQKMHQWISQKCRYEVNTILSWFPSWIKWSFLDASSYITLIVGARLMKLITFTAIKQDAFMTYF